ncbi:MAG: gephyrin-like molybdotransferase Glp [Pseudomonadota bacterium]
MSRPPLMPVQKALEISQRDIQLVATERVDLASAAGRVLAEDVTAKLTQPPFSASAMDGYALRSADLNGRGAELAIVGESAAGHGYSQPLDPGTCVRIFTGAPLPPNADTIAIQENVERLADTARISKAEAPGRYIRPSGGDFQIGQMIVAGGTKLNAQQMSLLASAGHNTIDVRRKPRVAVISTGDELVPVGTLPGPDQIISSNATGVITRIEAAGAEALDLGIALDRSQALQRAFQRAIDAQSDVVLTLGGASAGDHDLVKPVFTAMGGVLDLYRIAMRPGKPFMVGRLFGAHGETRLLGLPGNPVSSLVCTKLFVEPLIHAFLGLPNTQERMWGRLTKALGPNDEREDYSRCHVTMNDQQGWDVTPFEKQDSSLLHVAAAANALLCRPAHQDALPVGSPVQFIWW